MTQNLGLTDIQDLLAVAGTVVIAMDFDIDGATPALHRLAAAPRARVIVLSARSVADVRRRLPIDAIFAGNHGLEIAGGPFNFVHPEAERLAPQLARLCEAMEQAIAPWAGVRLENKRVTATVHLRDCPVDDRCQVRDAIRSVVRPVDDIFTLCSGRATFEITPRIGWDKGSAIKYILRELAVEDALTLCIGDEESQDLTGGITVRVCPSDGLERTYSLPSAPSIAELLGGVAQALENAPPRSAARLLARGLV